MKTNKSISKRVRVSKSGKLMVMKPGRNHFNSRSRRSKQLLQRKGKEITLSNKDMSRVLPFN